MKAVELITNAVTSLDLNLRVANEVQASALSRVPASGIRDVHKSFDVTMERQCVTPPAMCSLLIASPSPDHHRPTLMPHDGHADMTLEQGASTHHAKR